jgi:hypothetical protein
MDKAIDGILDEYMGESGNILHSLDRTCFEAATNEKSTPLRIRKKGMLAQTAMWSQIYNILLV